jgi:hypothetical protein
MGFTTEIPNDKGPRPYTGGAMPGPGASKAYPTPPNEMPGEDRARDEHGKQPATGGFVAPPNEHAPMPGHGGKM